MARVLFQQCVGDGSNLANSAYWLGFTGCRGKLRVRTWNGTDALEATFLGNVLRVSGGGTGCMANPSYMQNQPGGSIILIDVWQAYVDGAWTSSVAIPLTFNSFTSPATVYADAIGMTAQSVSKACGLVNTCAAALTGSATVTVLADGSFSIA